MGKEMATDSTKLQGELNERPEEQDLDVERLLAGLLRSLLDEQKIASPSPGSVETRAPKQKRSSS